MLWQYILDEIDILVDIMNFMTWKNISKYCSDELLKRLSKMAVNDKL